MSDEAISILLARARTAIEAGDVVGAQAAWGEAERLGGLAEMQVRQRMDTAATLPDGLSWCVWGAVGGSASAMWAAACCYRDAVGTRRDRVQAVRWYLAMLSVRDGDGVHEAIVLAKRMSEAQIRQAARLAGREADEVALLSVAGDRSRFGRLLRR